VPFQWKDQHTDTLDKLIQRVTTAPVLGCPNPKKQYFLEVDALAFTLGAVCFNMMSKKEEMLLTSLKL